MLFSFATAAMTVGAFLGGSGTHGKALPPRDTAPHQDVDLKAYVPDVERSPMIGVMGPGDLSDKEYEKIRLLGVRLAQAGFWVLSGGRDAGVMKAVNEGSASAGGFQVGVLPGKDSHHASRHLSVLIPTGVGNARNNLNTLAVDVLIAFKGDSDGTASEIALGRKNKKKVIILDASEITKLFWLQNARGDNTHFVTEVEDAVQLCKQLLGRD